MKKSVMLVVIVVLLLGSSLEWISRNAAAAAAAPPEISRVSPSDTGETFQIFGEGLDSSEIYVWQPTGTKEDIAASAELLPAIADLPAIPPAAAKKVAPIKAYPQVLYAQAIYSGVAVVWLKNAAGYSKPWLMNAPEIWTQSSFEAMPGERVQLYGQNLYVSSISTKVKPVVYLRNNETGRTYRASWGLANDQEMPNQNEKKFEWIVPADIPAGAYQLWVHNGSGGAFGWSQPGSLTVLASRDLIGMQAMAWNRTGIQVDGQTMAVAGRNVETVKAPNDGDLTDMTKELQKAIDKVADKGGGIVMLEAGTYGITHTLELKPGVVLSGVDKEATKITVAFGQKLAPFWPAIKPASRVGNAAGWAIDWEPFLKKMTNTPLIWIQTDAGLENLQLAGGAGTGSFVVVGTKNGETAKRVFFNRIKARYDGKSYLLTEGDWAPQYQGIVVMNKTEQFTIWQSEISAPGGLDMLPSQHSYARIIGNRFETTPAQGVINVYVGGMYHSIISENTFVNGKRSMMAQMGFSHNWVFQNRSEGVGRATNGQEEFMSEHGQASWLGTAGNITANSVTVTELTYDYKMKYGGTIGNNLNELETYLYIADGRGLGQYRKVTSIDNGVITLDRPWVVMPDTSTQFALMNAAVHNLWVNNTSSSGSGISQFVYGSGVENMIAGHEMLDSGGMSLWSFEYMKDQNGAFKEYGVLAYNQIVGVTSRYSGSHNASIVLWSKRGQNTAYKGKPYTIFGNIVRGNAIVGNRESALFINQTYPYWLQKVPNPLNFDPSQTSGIEVNGGFNLVERNFVLGLPNGVRVRGDGEGNLIRNNRTDVANQPLIDETGKSVFNPLAP